ncbi:MAG: transcriptional repressor LexA [Saccharofermentanales bacterium]
MKVKQPEIARKEFTRSTIDSTLNKIYDYITKFLDQEGYPPSVREICKGTGIKSTSTVHSHLKRLQDSGKLDYTAGRRRAISLTGSGIKQDAIFNNSIMQLPLVGVVTAGVPILAQENIERTLPFPSDFFANKGDVFVLQVKGDSMVNAAILDNDYVIIQKQSTARTGEYVVALIDDEATVKTLIKIGGKPYLKPENPKYDLIPFYNENCQILGKVVGVFRPSI